MGLSSIINNQVKSLDVSIQVMKTAQKNISHQGVEGYAKENVHVVSAGSNQVGAYAQDMGVTIQKISHDRDPIADREIVREKSKQQSVGKQDQLGYFLELKLEEKIDRIGEPDKISNIGLEALNNNGLLSYMDNFFNTAEELAGATISPPVRQLFLSQGEALCNKFNDLGKACEETAKDIENLKVGDIRTINLLLSDLSNINNQIIKARGNKSLGADLDYFNDRQNILEEIAHYISIEYQQDENPNPNGEPIFRAFVRGNDGSKVDLVKGSNIINQIVLGLNGEYLAESKQGVQTQIMIYGGSLKGYTEFSEKILAPFENSINELSQNMIRIINDAYEADFFDSGLDYLNAKTIRLNPSLNAQNLITGTASNPTGNDRLLKIINSYSSNDIGGFSDFYSEVIVSLGQKLSVVHQKMLIGQRNIGDLNDRRDSMMGVNENEEAANLQKGSRMYQSALRIIQVVDECLNDLLRILSK